MVDCGGGTVDVTVHELDVLNGQLHELHKATGGPHGSCGILINYIYGLHFAIVPVLTSTRALW